MRLISFSLFVWLWAACNTQQKTTQVEPLKSVEPNTALAQPSLLNVQPFSMDHYLDISFGDVVSRPSWRIWSIFQDSKGIFWFGSNGEGVYRYDGKEFLQFKKEDGLADDQVRSIQEDKTGAIWFNTCHGISRFNGRSIDTYPKDKSHYPTAQQWDAKPDDLWFPGNGRAVFRYDGQSLNYLELPQNALAEQYDAKHSGGVEHLYSVYSIFKDVDGMPWFGTQSLGVCRYDGARFHWINEQGLGMNAQHEGGAVRSIFKDTKGNYWLGNSGMGVFCYNEKGMTNARIEKGIGTAAAREKDARVSFMSIVEDNQGHLWFATYDAGLWRYDGKKVTQYTTKDGLLCNQIMAICKDQNGNLWLGTDGGGICVFDGKTFNSFNSDC